MNSFVHLHCHTDFSFLDGLCQIPALVQRTKELGFPAAAITDHGNMCGSVMFYKECKKQGIKPIIGCEFYLASEGIATRERSLDRHLVLLAKNQQGYLNLIKLLNFAHTEGYYYHSRIEWAVLQQNAGGLICLSGCLKGEVAQHILHDQYDKALKCATAYQELFGEDYYIELQNHNIQDDLLVLSQSLEIAKALNVKVVPTNDAHYLNANDAYIHELMLCVQTAGNIYDPNHFKFNGNEYWLKSYDEMRKAFQEDWLRNTLEVADKCQFEFELHGVHMPVFHAPDKLSPDEYLRQLVYEGATRIYGKCTDEIIKRIEYELSVITQTGFAGYFLIVWDIIHWAKSQGILVGGGRGSVAGSLVSYSVGITDINPLQFDLTFERFLTADRVSPPDIDCDFQDDRREEVINYITDKWGTEAVGRIISFSTIGAKGAIRDIGRSKHIPLDTINKLTKAIPETLDITIKQALEQSQAFQDLYNSGKEIKQLVDDSMRIEGVIRQPTVHPAGIVIVPDKLENHAPLYKSKANISLQYDMAAVDDLGLLKIDILGLKTLTVVADCKRRIQEQYHVDVMEHLKAFDDPSVLDLFANGQTLGVFQFESAGMRSLCKQTQPCCIADIMALNALYRPGCLGSGMIGSYVERKKNGSAEYLHPKLETILKDTYGVFVYQEQVMWMAQILAGFSLSESDELRKAMGKKDKVKLAALKPRFIDGAKKNKVSSDLANKIFDIVEPFAGYGFNKSHAAAYAVLAYQTAWLKKHYPAEFWAAFLTHSDKKDNMGAYIAEIKKSEVPLACANINKSRAEFAIVDGIVYYGFNGVAFVGEKVAQQIVTDREEHGAYQSLSDFCGRVKLDIRALQALIKAGAFDEFGYSRNQYLEISDSCLSSASKSRKKAMHGLYPMFDTGGMTDPKPLGYEMLENNAGFEMEVYGHYLDYFPYKDQLKECAWINQIPMDELSTQPDGAKVITTGVLTKVKYHMDKKNHQMAFATISNFSDSIDLVIFSSVFSEVGVALREGDAVVISGKYQTSGDAPKIIVNKMVGVHIALKHAQGLYILMPDQKSFLPLKKQMDTIIGEKGMRVWGYIEKKSLDMGIRVSYNDKVFDEIAQKFPIKISLGWV